MRLNVFLLLIVISFVGAHAQELSVDKLDQKYLNWHNRDPKKDMVLGTSVDRVYQELLKNRTPKKTVIVAIIDSGVDIEHEDLKNKIWTNENEIPDNGIDDDHNGYIDDIHGWNFIGNKSGENVVYENFEYTRIYKLGKGNYYQKAKQLYEAEINKRSKEKRDIAKFEEVYNNAKNVIKNKTGIEVNSLQDLDKISPGDDNAVLDAKRFLSSRYEKGFEEKMLIQLKKNNNDYLDKFLNTDYSPRSIVGDDPTNINDIIYGNADVKGQRADHGTAVAGVIAAIRDNNLGINGIATDVKIMCIRSTPKGDERDKDVALAIKYAVENGANIINMSFGKAMSPEKEFVDQATKLAETKGVLIIHSAGNSGLNIDEEESYPSGQYLDRSKASNWLTVGASGSINNDAVASRFSNYGQKNVDIFAPGENIISADTTNTYNMNDGTSLSSPVVSGIAALILSYYPDIKPQEMIQILIETSTKIEKKVFQPGLTSEDPRKVKFGTLSKSGGIVNAYEAMKRAEAK